MNVAYIVIKLINKHEFIESAWKDSPELKVLAITINSKVQQAFEFRKEQSSSS